jgi:predicted phosphodiesterase
MQHHNTTTNRRAFLKYLAVSATSVGVSGAKPVYADSSAQVRNVWVWSDAHVGFREDGLDGAEWLSKACADLHESRQPIDYALGLGDLVHNGTQEEFEQYLAVRGKSRISTWYELAGNHEYGREDLSTYNQLIRSSDPYSFVDGNIAWFFLSDEVKGVPGNLSEGTCRWLEESLTAQSDKIVIVCSHQLVHDTVRASDKAARYIHPREKLSEILAKARVDLWMCGHEHHRPYSHQEVARKDGTTFMNVASVSHAYGTKESQSYFLEFSEGAQKIVARRRLHDSRRFSKDFEVEIPLQKAIRIGSGS